MLHADHPLCGLQAQTAIATGWPTLHLYRSSEAAVLAARHAVEDLLGPLPQADVIEPWDPTDPSEPWELRIDLPGLDAAVWATLRTVLSAQAGPGPVLVPGLRDGERDARDQGWWAEEVLAAEGLVATMKVRAEGGAVLPDLQAGGEDPAVVDLEREVAEALQEAGVLVPFTSERGQDTLVPVVHRDSGRFGVQARFAPDTLAQLPGDELPDLRERVAAAFAAVVRARAEHPVLRLAPDLLWDTVDGLVLTAWIAAPAAAGLPADAPVSPGISPFPSVIDAWIAALDDQVEDLEIQVVPTSPRGHDAMVAAVMNRIVEEDWPVLGGRPRWLVAADGNGTWPVFVPTWRLVARRPLSAVLAGLAEVEGVDAVRVVPGEPAGLGEAWQQSRPGWHVGSARWFQRIRDALVDRDRLPEASERAETARDAEVALAAMRLLKRGGGARPAAPPRAVVDSTGRDGLELRLDPRALHEVPLRRALDALGAVPHPDLAPVAHWGYRVAVPYAYLWFRRDVSAAQ